MDYDFEWNPEKARINLSKHRVSFEDAASVFKDPHALSVYDPDHSEAEDRWITLGLSESGKLLIVSHTFREAGSDKFLIRIISSRKATRKEAKQYAGT